MTLTINGKPEEFQESLSLKQLLALKNLPQKNMIAEINGQILTQEDTLLKNGDIIELIQMVGGG